MKKITESDILRIAKKILMEQNKTTVVGGGSTKKTVISIDGNKISATEKGNIKIIDTKGNVYYYRMSISGFDTTVVDFGNETITVVDPSPFFGGDEITKPFKKDSDAMLKIKQNLGKDTIETTTNDGRKLILRKVN